MAENDYRNGLIFSLGRQGEVHMKKLGLISASLALLSSLYTIFMIYMDFLCPEVVSP